MKKLNPEHVYREVARTKRQRAMLGMAGLFVLLLIIAMLCSSFV